MLRISQRLPIARMRLGWILFSDFPPIFEIQSIQLVLFRVVLWGSPIISGTVRALSQTMIAGTTLLLLPQNLHTVHLKHILKSSKEPHSLPFLTLGIPKSSLHLLKQLEVQFNLDKRRVERAPLRQKGTLELNNFHYVVQMLDAFFNWV